MAQELSRIERPSADRYLGKRKLLLVPLVYGPPADAADGLAILQKYWDEVQAQISSLESTLGQLRHIYHESLTEAGEEGLKYLSAADQRSHNLVQAKCQGGALLESTEDEQVLLETLDLQRCLMVPLASEKVAISLQEWLAESNRSRYEKIGQQIDATLGEKELGLLMISERHQVQFAQDIEVFYVAPPALAEFKSWLQNWAVAQQKAAMDASAAQAETGEQEGSDPGSSGQ